MARRQEDRPLDPWGHLVGNVFREHLARGYDVWPTIAITRADIDMPEIRAAIAARRIRADGDIVSAGGNVRVMKAAIDPVWYLPGIAERFGLWESDLRHGLHEQTGGMYPELVTRSDLKVFLPPIGGTTIYCFGDPAKLGDGKTPLSCRVHDECNGSDVFGSDICTCRPLSRARHRDLHPDGAGRRRRARGLQPQGRPRARRGHQILLVYNAQTAEGRRPPGGLLQAHGMRRRRRTCGFRN
jgi:GTP cyclohydrolase II